MEGVFPGMEHYQPPLEIILYTSVYCLSGRALDSVHPSPWFKPHV